MLCTLVLLFSFIKFASRNYRIYVLYYNHGVLTKRSPTFKKYFIKNENPSFKYKFSLSTSPSETQLP